MPAVKIVSPDDAPKYAMQPDYAGGFIATVWVVAIAQFRIESIIDRMKGDRNDYWIMDFAATLYHEARHCQQKYWNPGTCTDDYINTLKVVGAI